MIEHSALYWTKAQARGLGGSDAAVSMCHRARRVPACLDEHVTAILSRLPWWVQQVAPRLLFLIYIIYVSGTVCRVSTCLHCWGV